MNIILVMIPLALVLLIFAVVIFFWAVNNGQFDDLDSPALMPLEEDRPRLDDADSDEDVQTPPKRD